MINEALTQPASTWNCSELAGTFSQQQDSWIELYNPESQPLDLFAARAEISLDDGSTWDYLPFGSAIAPHGFLVIFPEENQADLRSTWTVVLDIANTTVDQASIPQLLPDQSYARVPDGSQNWQSAALPTIDTSNNVSGQSTTPTPSKTPRPTKTPQGSAANSSSGTGTPNDDGTQPAWNGVQLPPNITVIVLTPADPTTPPLSQSQGPPAAQSSEPGSWHGALSILLVVLLLTALVWCWRLFRAP